MFVDKKGIGWYGLRLTDKSTEKRFRFFAILARIIPKLHKKWQFFSLNLVLYLILWLCSKFQVKRIIFQRVMDSTIFQNIAKSLEFDRFRHYEFLIFQKKILYVTKNLPIVELLQKTELRKVICTKFYGKTKYFLFSLISVNFWHLWQFMGKRWQIYRDLSVTL